MDPRALRLLQPRAKQTTTRCSTNRPVPFRCIQIVRCLCEPGTPSWLRELTLHAVAAGDYEGEMLDEPEYWKRYPDGSVRPALSTTCIRPGLRVSACGSQPRCPGRLCWAGLGWAGLALMGSCVLLAVGILHRHRRHVHDRCRGAGERRDRIQPVPHESFGEEV